MPSESACLEYTIIPIQTGQVDLHIVSVFVESLNQWIDRTFDQPCVFVKNRECLLCYV